MFGEIYDEEDIEEDHHGEDLIKMVRVLWLVCGNCFVVGRSVYGGRAIHTDHHP